jgi:hypothetical protein
MSPSHKLDDIAICSTAFAVGREYRDLLEAARHSGGLYMYRIPVGHTTHRYQSMGVSPLYRRGTGVGSYRGGNVQASQHCA